MSNKLKELLEKRASLITQGRELLDRAANEKRALTAEEQSNYDKYFNEAQGLHEAVKRFEQQDTLEKSLDKAVVAATEEKGKSGEKADEYRSALQKYFIRGQGMISESEHRALSQGSAPDGGYLVPREQFIGTLLKFVDDIVFIRGLATVFRLEKAASLGYPSLDTDMSDNDWTSEVGQVQEDTAMKVGKRELTPHMLSKRAKISMKLLQNAVVAPDTLVLERLGYKVGVTQEKAFILGNGVAQPLGFMVASNLGVPTSRDISAGNTTTSPTMDGLLAAKFALKQQYWARAQWVMHRDCGLRISQLKDAENRYLWQPSTQVGSPDRLHGLAVNYSEFMGNTFTTGQYVAALADFSFYHIAETVQYAVQRLNELYAETNQIGFIGRGEVDGMPALAEAFVRVKLA